VDLTKLREKLWDKATDNEKLIFVLRDIQSELRVIKLWLVALSFFVIFMGIYPYMPFAKMPWGGN
jgi:hypothetical protein